MGDEVTTETVQDNTDAVTEESTSFLPEDLQGNELLSGYKTPAELANAFIEKHTAHTELTGKYAAPESPDAYKLEIENAEESKAFREMAHRLGMPQDMAQGLAEEMNRVNTEMNESQEKVLGEAREAAVASLKKDWGDAFDANVEGAKKIVRTLGDENLSKWLDETQLGDVVPFVRFCQKVSTLISEDSLEEGGHKTEPERTEDGRLMLKYASMEESE
jgi:hypothetical protein